MAPMKILKLVPVVVLSFLLAGASAQESPKPNIVYVVADDMDQDLMMQLPNVKALLRDEGTTLTNFNIPESICCPSRATTLLGEYPHNTGVWGNANSKNGGVEGFNYQGGPARSVGVELQSQGYRTGLFGKYLNNYNTADVPPGWNRWFGKHRQRYYDYEVADQGEIVSYGSKPAHYGDRIIGLEANAWVQVRSAGTAPFFAYVSPTAPHAPYDDPPAHQTETPPDPDLYTSKPSYNEADRSDKPAWLANAPALTAQDKADIAERYTHRYRMSLEVDDMVADIYASLEAAGELENTYFIFTSDNGWFNGEHALPEKKLTPYEETTNVGAIVRGPGIPAGVELDDLTSNTDLFATFSDIAGEEEPRDGRSLLPLLEGTAASWREQVLLEHPITSPDRPLYYGIKTDRYKYVEDEDGEKELYDLWADPYELENVYETADPALVAELKTKLEALKTCSGAACRVAEDAS